MDCYFNRVIAFDGNNFQWKINVAMRSFATFCRVLPSCFRLPSSGCHAIPDVLSICLFLPSFCFLLLLIPDVLLLPSARRSICPEVHLPGGPSARRVVGAYPFSKKGSLSFLPPKIPANFSKNFTLPPTFNTLYP